MCVENKIWSLSQKILLLLFSGSKSFGFQSTQNKYQNNLFCRVILKHKLSTFLKFTLQEYGGVVFVPDEE